MADGLAICPHSVPVGVPQTPGAPENLRLCLQEIKKTSLPVVYDAPGTGARKNRMQDTENRIQQEG